MTEITYGYKKKNTKLLKKAEAIAEKLSINLALFMKIKLNSKMSLVISKKLRMMN